MAAKYSWKCRFLKHVGLLCRIPRYLNGAFLSEQLHSRAQLHKPRGAEITSFCSTRVAASLRPVGTELKSALCLCSWNSIRLITLEDRHALEETVAAFSYLAPESEVLYFGFEVSNVGDLGSVFPGMVKKQRLLMCFNTFKQYLL